jgi:hypothetical protein
MARRCQLTSGVTAALLVLSALLAQLALAVPLTIEGGESGTTFYTGDQDGGTHVLTTTATVKCTTASFTASSSGASVNELTVTPSYSGCSAFGFATAHWKTNGCTYTYSTPTTITSNEVTYHPSGRLFVCPGGSKMEITPTAFGVSVCTQSIPPQEPKGGHTISRNAGSFSAMDVTYQFTLFEIQYTGTGGACGSSGANGTYEGSTTWRCFQNSAHTTVRGCTWD